MRKTWICVLALSCTSCAETGVLELAITLPAQPASDPIPLFANIQVRPTEGNPFSTRWDGGNIESIALGADAFTDCISVVSRDMTIDVNIRVWFCHDPDCLAFGDDAGPERFYRLQHPFYIGRRTFWSTTIANVPTCTTDADCDVGVCLNSQCQCVSDENCCAGIVGCTLACDTGVGVSTRRCVEEVDRCRIEGCILGDPAMDNFCHADGTHFCETTSIDRTEEAYMCAAP